MEFEIFTYGNGQVMSDLLNGIALIVYGDNYKNLMKIGVMLAFASLLLGAAFELKFEKIVRWYLMVMMITGGLIYPHCTVYVTDVILRNQMRRVDNVPVGLGYMLSVLTRFEYGLTEMLETALHVPNQLSYNQTGMLMATDMIRKASAYKITNPDFANDIKSFMHQCVQYDILHGRYRLEDLFTARDMWDFIVSQTTNSRAFILDEEITPCRTGAIKFSNKWNKELEDTFGYFAKQFHPGNISQQTRSQFLTNLEISYQHMMNISSSASKIMQQNMIINAYHDSVLNNAAKINAPAAIESYAVARATQNARSSYKLSGEVAGRLLPYIKNVIQLIIVGAIIIVLPLFFFMSGVSRIKQFLEILASLSIWAPLYAILNLQMTSVGREKLIGFIIPPGSDQAAITLANLSGLEQIAADQVLLAGYLSLSIPLIAYGLIKGSTYAFSSLASGVMGVPNSAVSLAADEAVTGNYDVGQLNVDNVNLSNLSTFQNHTDLKVGNNAVSVARLNGSEITYQPDGSMVIDQSGAISQMAFKVNYADILKQSLTAEEGKMLKSIDESSKVLSMKTEQVYSELYDLSKAITQGEQSGESHSMSNSAEFTQAMSQYKNKVDQVAKEKGISNEQVFSMYASVGMSTPLAKTKIFGISPPAAEAKISVEGGAAVHADQSMTESMEKKNEYQDSINHAMNAVKNTDHSRFSQSEKQAIERVQSSIEEKESLEDNLTASLQKTHDIQETIGFVEAHSASITMNGTQHVVDQIFDHVNPETGDKYTREDLDEVITHPHKLGSVINQIVAQEVPDIIASKGTILLNQNDLSAEHQERTVALGANQEQIRGHYDAQMSRLHHEANIQQVDTSVIQGVEAQSAQVNHEVNNSQAVFERGFDAQKASINHEISEGAAKQTVKNLFRLNKKLSQEPENG